MPPPDITMTRTADGSASLYSERYQQTFHSHKGALSESRHVFLGGTGITGRAARGEALRVLEVGFGSGLNFFLSADVCEEHGARLHYVALEQTLLPAEIISRLGYQAHLMDPQLLNDYLTWRETLGENPRGQRVWVTREGIRLELILADATQASLPEDAFDAIYLDAFSPDANPELWSEAFLAKLRDSLDARGILASYCVKGEVRRRMQALGLCVQKRPGPPGGKREMLLAAKDAAVLP